MVELSDGIMDSFDLNSLEEVSYGADSDCCFVGKPISANEAKEKRSLSQSSKEGSSEEDEVLQDMK